MSHRYPAVSPSRPDTGVRMTDNSLTRHGVTVLNSPGTIDADYRGEVKVLLVNHGDTPFAVERGMRIAQLVVAQHAHVEWVQREALEETVRGPGGFGSTGTE